MWREILYHLNHHPSTQNVIISKSIQENSMLKNLYKGFSLITILALMLMTLPMQSAQAVSTSVVISQVYGGAGCGTAGCSTYKNDYIELFNRGASPVSLNGWSVQYASATGTAWQVTNLTNVTLQPGQYYLVGEGADGVNNIPAADAPGTIAMSATAAKVALVNTTTALSGTCPASASIVDLVGYGATASCFETAVAPAPSTTNADIRGMGGCTETDNNSTDFTAAAANPRNTASPLNVCGGVTPTPTPTPSLSINDVSQDEGNAGTTNFNFTVSLSQPAQTGGVSFTVNTADGTTNPATAGSDYVAIVGGAGSIPEGSSSTQVTVQVNGDMTTEPNETFFVNISGVTGAGVTDAQGLGTIQNDDVTVIPIHDIQGNGNASPLVGQSVTTTGIVTGRKTNGYFIQDPVADADPNTSEAMFVFTSSAPSAAITVGDSVRVSGNVVEFISATSDEPVTPSDPKTATEISSPTTTILSSGNPLPAPLTEAILVPASPSRSAELEKYEYMRVSISSLTVTQPTNNNFGEFWGVTTGTPRPFREPGLEAGDPIPAADEGPHAGATPPNVPIFDGNFERILIDSDDAANTSNTRRSAIFVTSGAVVTGIVGPLDFGFDDYRIVLDFNASTNVTPGIAAAIPVPTPTASEFTISHANLENFSSSNATKLNKASLAIRNVLHTPDVVGLIEVDSTASANALATKINADAGNPSAVNYVAHFNDTAGTQDIGYLVNTARVTVNGTIMPYHQANNFTYCGVTSVLHDRPSLVLSVDFPQQGGGTIPVTIILNHTKSLIAVDSQASFGTCGTGTEGARNREKRRQQAEDIADLIQSHIAENLVVLGDMNAFDFNDGLQDMVGTLKGNPAPANTVVEPSTDRWTYTLTNLINTLPADQRYSFAFEGNAQALDHVLVNALMLERNTRYAYGRYNGDFSNDFAANANTPERVADHDAPAAYFSGAAPQPDLAISKTADRNPAPVEFNFNYNITVTNTGAPASNVVVTDPLPSQVTLTSMTTSQGTCTYDSGTKTVTCNLGTVNTGTPVNIKLTVKPREEGTLNNTATVTTTDTDSDTNNNSASANGIPAVKFVDLAVTKTAASDPLFSGENVTYTILVKNINTPISATGVALTDTLPASETFVSATTSQGSLVTPPVGST